MTTTGDVFGDDWDDTDEIAPEVPPAGSRRLLLGRAAGGLVLAASGLFLPEWLEETEAREGELGGKLGGRHGKNRRGRNQRNRGDRKGNDKDKDKDKPRGRDFFDMRNMAIAVHNYRPTVVRVRGWQPADCGAACNKWEMPSVWDWKELPGRTGAQHSSTEFVSARTHVAVQIGDNRVVEGFNRIEGLPFAIIRTGGWGNRGGIGGEELKRVALWVDRNILAGDIRVTRVGDTEEHILFSVDIT